jgi:uncharacterized protein (UPF0335 family)
MSKRKAHDPIEENLAETKTVRGMGDNSGTPVEGKRLLKFIEGIERLNERKKQIGQEISEAYANCKAVGYDNRTIRAIIKERNSDKEKMQEQQELLNVYRSALRDA